jgi:hypothetical protein
VTGSMRLPRALREFSAEPDYADEKLSLFGHS